MQTLSDRDPRIKSKLIDGIALVDLRVTDLDRAVAFYRDVVGLEPTERDDHRASLRAPQGPVILNLDSRGVTAPADPHATGLFHTAFRFPTRTELGNALARVVRARLELGAADHLVSEALYIDDPDGNGVELYWDRPVEEWPPPTDDALTPMASLALDLDGLFDQRDGADEAAPPGTDIGHVHLQISDVSKTIAFYVDVLGLDLTARFGGSAGFFSSKGYHHNIGANMWRSRGGKPASRERAGLDRVVFAVSDRELQALRDRLGDKVESATDDLVVVRDPDGIELQFVAGT